MLECRFCAFSVALVERGVDSGDDESTAERVAWYLTETYEVDLPEAFALVRRHVATVFEAIDKRQPTRVVADAVAGRAMLRERDPHSLN